MGSVIATDANGIKTLVPPPPGEGGDLLLDNDARLSALRTTDLGAIVANAAGIVLNDTDIAANVVDIAANVSDIADNDDEILALQNETTAYGVTNQAVVGDGVTDDYAAIMAAQVQAGIIGKWLSFPGPGTYLIESNIVFTVPVLFTGGVLKLAAGVTATFNEPYMNPSRQKCFDEQGRTPNQAGGVIVAEASPQDTVRPEDWGGGIGVANGHIMIQQAIDAVSFPRSSVGKVGRVLFSSGTYLLADSVFIGYDWETYSAWWGNHEAAGATTCWKGDANTAQGRKNFVCLEGTGQTFLQYTGAEANTKYLIYTVSTINAKGFPVIKNLAVDLQYNCRGIYASGYTYGSTFDGLFIYRSLHVGLDWIDCWGSRLLDIFCWVCRGIDVRTSGANSCFGETLNASNSRSNRDEHWPSPTDETVKGFSGFIQTRAWERAVLVLAGGTTEWHNTIVESSETGSALWGLVSGAPAVTVTKGSHGLGVGDPLYLFEDGTKTAVAAAPAPTTDVFTVDDAFGGTGRNLIYRRCSGITRANPGVFDCQNHGLAEGEWIKIMNGSGAGMDNPAGDLHDTWYRVKRIDEDSFSLWTLWPGEPPVFATELDTSAGAGFSAADGSEYIVSSAVGILLSSGARLINTRFEGNSILRSKILQLHGTQNSVIDGVSLDDDNEGPCDYVVEWQNRIQNNVVKQVAGNGIRKSIVFWHTPWSASFEANGNRIEDVGHNLDFPLGTDATVEWDGTQQGNVVNGVVTPISALEGDPTPSVWGNQLQAGVGTVAVNNGATTVTGTGSSFLTDYAAGDDIRFDDGNGDPVTSFVDSVTDDTSLELSPGFTGVNTAGVSYSHQASGLGQLRTRINGALMRVVDYTGEITFFDDGTDGQLLKCFFLGANVTIVHNPVLIVTSTGGNLTPAAFDELSFRLIGRIWYEV